MPHTTRQHGFYSRLSLQHLTITTADRYNNNFSANCYQPS